MPTVIAALTPAEVEVARLAGEGVTNAQIARLRGVSRRTVANQMSSILGKLGLGSRAGLAILPELAAAGAGVRPIDWTRLTGTQRSILAHASRGRPQKEIAFECGVAPSTVCRAMKAARVHLGFGSLSELLRACAIA